MYLGNVAKDWLCLPRPASPPVRRLSRNPSHGEEYGFPSSHAMTSVFMSLMCSFYLCTYSSLSTAAISVSLLAFGLYGSCICLSRLYCGMHFITDVTAGVVFGFMIFASCWITREFVLEHVFNNGDNYLLVIFSTLVLLWLHPIPMTACPCFDDSIAFLAVVAGIVSGLFSATMSPFCGIACSDISVLWFERGWIWTVLYVIVSYAIIIAWRILTKQVCRAFLPKIAAPISRWIASLSRTVGEVCPCQDPAVLEQSSEVCVCGTLPQSRLNVANVTKYIVYFGIGYLVVFPIPVLWELLL